MLAGRSLCLDPIERPPPAQYTTGANREQPVAALCLIAAGGSIMVCQVRSDTDTQQTHERKETYESIIT